MFLPPNSNDPRFSVTFGAEHTVTFWIRPNNGQGTLLGKTLDSDPYDTYYIIGLDGSFIPYVTINGYDLDAYSLATATCNTALTNSEWYNLGVTLTVDTSNDFTVVTFYHNGVQIHI